MEAEPRSLDPDKLIAHSAFIRSIASALLKDHDAAEDIVQDTWLRALERSPRPEWKLEAWLAGVAGNLARALTRSRDRRSRREQARARPEAVASTIDTIARLETFRAVVDCVQDLGEPYRRVVLLRHFDGLPLREIAKLLGTPVETVHTRLRRAHEQLRARLDARHEGRREAWSLALLPLIDPLGPTAATAATVATGGSAVLLSGALIMNTKILVTVSAVLLLAVLTFPWGIGSPADLATPTTADLSPAAAPDRAANVTEADAAEAGGRRASSGPINAPAGFIVRGKATRGDAGFAGAKIRARAFLAAQPDASIAEARLGADDRGEFMWTFEPPREAVIVSFEGAEDDHLAGPVKSFVAPGEPPPDPCEVRFYRLDCRLRGTVRDERGTPIAGATVRSMVGEVTTDDQGAFATRLASMQPFTGLLWVTAAGHTRTTDTVHPGAPGNHVHLDLRLRREVSISGVVRDEQGQPIQGAEVTSRMSSKCRTDAEGRFELRGLDPAHAAQYLAVTHEDYVPTGMTGTAGAHSEPHVIVLKRGVRIEGSILGPAGAPQAGTGVFLDRGPIHGNVPAALSAADGSFVLRAVEPGAHLLLAFRRGVGIARASLDVPAEREVISGVKLQLETGHHLAGQVVDAARNPLGGAWVSIDAKSPSGSWVTVASCTTGDDGRFRAEGLPSGSVAVALSKAGFFASHGELKREPPNLQGRWEREEHQVDRDDVVLTMRPAGRLTGRVLDAASDQPIDGFRLRFVPAKLAFGEKSGSSGGFGDEGRWFQESSGAWDTGTESLLRPGTFVGIEVSAPGHAPWRDDHVLVPDAAAAPIVARLQPALVLVGRVVSDPGDAPVSGAKVTLFRDAELFQRTSPEDVHAHPLCMTDAEGRFRFDAVAAGSVSLAVKPPRGAGVIDGPFQVAAGGAERIVRLHGGGRIDGVVIDEEGRPVAHAIVLLRPDNIPGLSSADVARTTADATGGFSFAGVASGNHTVTHLVDRAGMSAHIVSIGVSVLAPGTREVRLHPGAGTATLQIERKHAQGMPMFVAVSLVPSDQAQGSQVPWEERRPTRGGFLEEGKPLLIRKLPAGEYFLMRQPFGWMQKVVLVEGQTTSTTMPR